MWWILPSLHTRASGAVRVALSPVAWPRLRRLPGCGKRCWMALLCSSRLLSTPRQSPPRPSRRTHAARPRAPNSDRHLSCTVAWGRGVELVHFVSEHAARHDISLQECFLHVKPFYWTFCKCSFACMKCQVRYLLYNRPDTGQQTRAGDFFLCDCSFFFCGLWRVMVPFSSSPTADAVGTLLRRCWPTNKRHATSSYVYTG